MIPQLFTTMNETPTEFKDPFQKDCVSCVHIHLFNGSGHTATVETQNGDTKGEQRFNSNDPNDLFFRIENYINQLE